MLVHARSGDTAFAACLRLFRQYPLAVRRHYAEHRYGSMVLLNRAAGAARFYVLIMEWDDLFVLRHWDRRDGARAEIGADAPAAPEIRALIETSVPVPRDGALLGWLAGLQGAGGGGRLRPAARAVGRRFRRARDPGAAAGRQPARGVAAAGGEPARRRPAVGLPRGAASWPTSPRWSPGRPGACSGYPVTTDAGPASASSSPSG